MRWFGAVSLRLGLAALLAVSWLSVAGGATAQTLEPDNDDDVYDQFTCSGIEEDEVEDVSDTVVQFPFGSEDLDGSSSQNLGNDPDEYSPFPNNGFEPTFDVISDDSSFSFESSNDEDEISRGNDAFMFEPTVQIDTVSSVTPGEEATVVINPSGFGGQEIFQNKLYIATFVDGQFMNGVTAGGDQEALDEQSLAVTDASRPDCGIYGRVPTLDVDRDGMDDNWEVRYGLNPANPADAGQDPDNDGYFADSFPNFLGEFMQPAPGVAGASLGDGKFTNYEEYLLGTNPLVADSDGDGFQDEADAVGLGQNVVNFIANKPASAGPYLVHTIVIGVLEKRNEDEMRLTKIDSSTIEIPVGIADDLQVTLDVVTPIARAGETLEVQTLLTDHSLPELSYGYRWLINGALQNDLSGISKKVLRYKVPVGTRTGTQIVIEVQVLDPNTGQLARGRTTIVLGDDLLMEFDPESVELAQEVLITAQLASGKDPDEVLYLWSLDGLEQHDQSKIGQSVFTLTPSNTGGNSHVVTVQALERATSKKIGEGSAELLVLPPQVALILTPEEPVNFETVTAHAQTEHFAGLTLQYEFRIDGELQSSGGPQVTFNAGADGSVHTVTVRATSVDQKEFATDAASFVTRPSGLSANITAPTQNLTASLLGTGLVGIAGLGAVVVLLGLGGIFKRQRVLS